MSIATSILGNITPIDKPATKKATARKTTKKATTLEIPAAPTIKASMGIVDKMLVATRDIHRTTFYSGILIGGFVPLASFSVFHFGVLRVPYTSISFPMMALFVLGCLGFSFPKVFTQAKVEFSTSLEAVCYTTLLEVAILLPHSIHWAVTAVSIGALVITIAINATVTASKLIEKRKLDLA